MDLVEPYLMTSLWRHQRLYGSLITDENHIFLGLYHSNLAISHPIFTKLDMNDGIRSVIYIFNDVMMTISSALRVTDYRRKGYILHYNLAISHPIFTKLSMSDGIRSIINYF